jgi:hypothetical protein
VSYPRPTKVQPQIDYGGLAGRLHTGGKAGQNDITADLPRILHLYVSPSQFSPNKLGIDIDESAIGALEHESAFEDPLLTEIAYAIASELQTETSAGSMLVESLASSIAARLVQKHASTSPARSYPLFKIEGLDRRRLFRVLDYIEANLEGDLSASIAWHRLRASADTISRGPSGRPSGNRRIATSALGVLSARRRF